VVRPHRLARGCGVVRDGQHVSRLAWGVQACWYAQCAVMLSGPRSHPQCQCAVCCRVLARTRCARVRGGCVMSLAAALPAGLAPRAGLGSAAARATPQPARPLSQRLRLRVGQQTAPCHSGCGCGPLSITSHCAYQMPGTPHASRDTCCPRSTTPQPRANRCSAGVFASAVDRLRPTGSGCSRRRRAASARPAQGVRVGGKPPPPDRFAPATS
jgi:hypothetical protein